MNVPDTVRTVEAFVDLIGNIREPSGETRYAEEVARDRLYLAVDRDIRPELYIEGELESFGDFHFGPVLSWGNYTRSDSETPLPALVIRTEAGVQGRRIMGHIAYEAWRVVASGEAVNNSDLLTSLRPFLRLALTKSMLSAAEQVGLVGELQVLHEILDECETDGDQMAALDAWVGPLGARRDFSRSTTVVEVKSSMGLSHRVGYEQLLSEPGEVLFLASVKVRRDPSAGLKLPDQVQRVYDELVSAELREQFKRRLEAYGGEGYHSRVSGQYRLDHGFFLEPAQLRRLDEDSPILRPESFVAHEPSDAVSGINYSLDVLGMPAVSAAQKRDVLRSLVR